MDSRGDVKPALLSSKAVKKEDAGSGKGLFGFLTNRKDSGTKEAKDKTKKSNGLLSIPNAEVPRDSPSVQVINPQPFVPVMPSPKLGKPKVEKKKAPVPMPALMPAPPIPMTDDEYVFKVPSTVDDDGIETLDAISHIQLYHVTENKHIAVDTFPFKLGRAGDYRIAEDKLKVSREHAEIISTSGGFMVRDTNSKHGTFVDGKRIRPGVLVPLQNGTCLLLKDEEFKVFIYEK
jgi:hypothetical protein